MRIKILKYFFLDLINLILYYFYLETSYKTIFRYF